MKGTLFSLVILFICAVKSQGQQLNFLDTVQSPVRASLLLSSDKNEIYSGECIHLELDFVLSDENRVPLKFYELADQLNTLISKSFISDSAWMTNNSGIDINGVHSDDKRCTNYRIINLNYCPAKAGEIQFPELELRVAKLTTRKEFHKLVKFRSNALRIKVKSLPNQGASNYDQYGLTGNFNLNDSFNQPTADVNSIVEYRIEISGEGLTYPITAPEIRMANVKAELVDVIDTDASLPQKHYSSKVFIYKLIFAKAGQYDFKNSISFSYIDPNSLKLVTLDTQGSITVFDNPGLKKNAFLPKVFYSKENLILIDGSQSMLIEDYSPNRMKAVTNGLKIFLKNRAVCDIGLIEFAGYPKFINIAVDNSCYSERLISRIDWMSDEGARGTAIGEAVFFAKSYIKKSTKEQRIVVIGDGDNTAGHILPSFAAALAAKSGIKIFSIGVGNSGLVPYGKDSFGRPQMVDNTFSDITLKQIATITGGEYFWAKDANDLTKILEKIFSK